MALQPFVFRFGSISVYFATAAPTGTGDWPPFQVGDIVVNTTTPAGGAAQVTFWACSVASSAGSAGTWVAGPTRP
jgi:hypothetical protein